MTAPRHRVADIQAVTSGLIISPSLAYRETAGAREVSRRPFVEVFLDTPLEICEKRDPKGLYRKARAGEIEEFTGVSSPYEPPEAPELRVDAGDMSVEDSVEAIMALLTGRSLLG